VLKVCTGTGFRVRDRRSNEINDAVHGTIIVYFSGTVQITLYLSVKH